LVAALCLQAKVRAYNNERLREWKTAVQAALVAGREQEKGHQYSEAVRTLTRGLQLAQQFPGDGELARALTDQLRLTRGAEEADRLHAAVEHMRFLAGADPVPTATIDVMMVRCHGLWEGRARLIGLCKSGLGAETAARLQTDLYDLALLWTDFRL